MDAAFNKFTDLFDSSKDQPASDQLVNQNQQMLNLMSRSPQQQQQMQQQQQQQMQNQTQSSLGRLYVPGYAPNPDSSVGQPSWNALPPPPSGVRRVRAPQDSMAAQVMNLSSSDPAAAQVWNMSSDSQLGKFGSSFGGAYSKGGKSYRRKARKAAKKSRKARKAAKKSRRSSRR